MKTYRVSGGLLTIQFQKSTTNAVFHRSKSVKSVSLFNLYWRKQFFKVGNLSSSLSNSKLRYFLI